MKNVYYVLNKKDALPLIDNCKNQTYCNYCSKWLRADRYGYCECARLFGSYPYTWEDGGIYKKCNAPNKFMMVNMTEEVLTGEREDKVYVTLGR